MSKFKTGLSVAIEEHRAFEREQKELKEKHNIEDENVVIVEKKSIMKFCISLLLSGLKLIAVVLLLLLATAGVMTLLYPTPREALIAVLAQILAEGRSMIPWL